uniref:Major facilitator superfamily (MFS) profile domain-containing protein n=1 Tax=Caenorhabditis japonica TaxID=281687 RepID=A0A8R1HQQ3_CAEJA
MNTYNFTKICMQDDNSTSKVSTALVPLASSLGYGWFVTARIFQGMAFSATFPLAGSITSKWATPHEHGVFIGFLTGNTQLANIFTMPVSGWLCSSSAGWTSVYYVHAAVTLITFAVFFLFFKSSPNEHSWVSEKEVEKIGVKKIVARPKQLPFRHILTSLSLWACWIASFGDLITVQLVSQFNPQYMNNYLNYDVLSSGFLAALPIIFQFAIKLLSGISSDMITSISETWKTKIFNTIALAVAAAFFIILAFVPQEKHLLAIIIMICAESVMGANTAGFNKCATLHSQQYAYFAMQQIMNIWACTIFIEPFFVNMIVTENSFIDWRNCFLAHAALLLFVNVIFCMFADASPASWTNQNGDESGEEEVKEEGVGGAEKSLRKTSYDSITFDTKL